MLEGSTLSGVAATLLPDEDVNVGTSMSKMVISCISFDVLDELEDLVGRW